jgi:hypothetical protein
MNDWARADGADNIAKVATAAAINFDLMNWFLPEFGPESGRLRVLGQPMTTATKNARGA